MAGRFKQYKGTTAGGGSVILGSLFWEKDKKVVGIYTRSWQSSVGECYEFLTPPNTPKPIAWVDSTGRVVEAGDAGAQERPLEKFSIGALTGFQMAMQDMNSQLAMDGQKPLEFRDQLTITCVGFQAAAKRGNDDMPLFELELER